MKSNLASSLSSEARKRDYAANRNQPVCPKPRRPTPTMSEVLEPLRHNKHRCSYQPNDDGKGKTLSICNDKTLGEKYDTVNGGCSLRCYSGSPPGRTDNPLIHDVQFINQMELLTPLSVRTKLSDKFNFTSPTSSI